MPAASDGMFAAVGSAESTGASNENMSAATEPTSSPIVRPSSATSSPNTRRKETEDGDVHAVVDAASAAAEHVGVLALTPKLRPTRVMLPPAERWRLCGSADSTGASRLNTRPEVPATAATVRTFSCHALK